MTRKFTITEEQRVFKKYFAMRESRNIQGMLVLMQSEESQFE